MKRKQALMVDYDGGIIEVWWVTKKQKEKSFADEEKIISEKKVGRHTYVCVLVHDLHENIYDRKNFLKCTCGYEGEAQWYQTNIIHNYEWKPGDKVAFYMERLFQCPTCQNRDFLKIWAYENKEHIYHTKIEDHTKNKENPKPTISFVWNTIYYRHIHREKDEIKDKISVYQKRFRITHNTETGLTYLISINPFRIWTITHGNLNKDMEKALKLLEKFDKNQKTKLTKFFNLCLKKRGVHYTKLQQIKHHSAYTLFQQYQNVLLYLRYPFLQNMNARLWGSIPLSVRKKLNRCDGTTKQMYESFFNHGSKKVRTIKTNAVFEELVMWGQVITNIDYFLTLKERLEAKGFELHSTSSVFHSAYEQRVKELKWHRKRYKTEAQFFHFAMRLFKENHYADVWNILSDTYDMYKQLKQVNPSYNPPFIERIDQYHDFLSRDFGRMGHEKRIFSYKEQDKERFQQKIDNYSFQLPEHTHDLIDLGNEMDICVGSYGDRVLDKKSLITFVFDEKEKVTMCLEIKPHRTTPTLVQAKLNHNDLPSKKQANIVKQWCEKVKVDYKNCQDLR